MKIHKLWWKLIYLHCLLILIATGCAGDGTQRGTFVWIDVPVNDLTIPLGETINFEGHATSPEGVSRVEIWINSELTMTVEELPTRGDLVSFKQTWTPPEGGDYIIMAVAFGESGNSSTPDSVIVHVGATSSVPAASEPTLVEITATPTEETLPEASVQFRADPPEIKAGACSVLRWQVENAQKVVLGSTEVGAQGSYEVCLCENTRYRLTVTYLDSTEEVFPVLIQVSGTCATPTPDIDGTPPPAPQPLKPVNGTVFGCIADTILRWEAVSDDSGIAEYRVEAQRRSGGGSWNVSPGSPWFGIHGTELLFSVECAWEYRWRVRAVDGAGNIGPWSNWWSFDVPLQ